MQRIITLLIVWLLSFASHASFNIQQTKLDNGLTIVFMENHVVPAIYHAVIYDVGAKNETEKTLGAAHFLEHMMFRGTEKFPESYLDKFVSNGGGNHNAETTYDYTNYYQFMPVHYLEHLMEIEADRMQNITIDADNLETERNIILQERKMRIDNVPAAQYFEEASAKFWQNDPRAYPVIGYEDNIKNLQLEDLQKFHAQYYAPNNATLIVVGDTDFETVKQLAQKHFGSIEAKSLPAYNPPQEPNHPTRQRLEFSHERFLETSITNLYLAAPKAANAFEQDIRLSVLANILGGDTGLLYQSLILEQDLAYDVDFDLQSTIAGGRSAYVISADAAYPEKEEELLAAIDIFIDDFLSEPIPQEMIDRVTKRATNEVLLLKEEAMHIGAFLGYYIMLGYDINDLNTYVEQMQKITAEEVHAAAKDLFTQSKPTTIVMKAPMEAK